MLTFFGVADSVADGMPEQIGVIEFDHGVPPKITNLLGRSPYLETRLCPVSNDVSNTRQINQPSADPTPERLVSNSGSLACH